MITYLAKLGELTLKGANIREFERQLLKNIRRSLEGTGANVTLRAGRMYIDCDEAAAARAEFALSHLLGITGWARAQVTEKNLAAIQNEVFEAAKKAAAEGAASFKVDVRRADKKFPLNSYEIACRAADPVFDAGILRVDVHKPDVIIHVEVRERCFVFAASKQGCRGLPVGCSGKGLLLLSGGLDSPVAGYRMLRRGMKVDCIYFHSYPYTSVEAQQKVEMLAKRLSCYGLHTCLNIIPFTDVQMRIKEKAPEAWTTLMLRVCMVKAAALLVRRIGADCMITGESLGQVASQTVENMNVTEHFSEIPLFRPLVGMDKEEIVETANFIGTFDISILPYEDCCVLFSPKHPVLRGSISEAERIYRVLDCDALIQEAFEKREVKRFTFGEAERRP